MPVAKRRVEFTRRAATEYLSGLHFIASDNPDAGRLVQDRIDATLALLGSRPLIGRTGRIRGTREFPVQRTPYTLVYRVRPGEVQILRVLHQRRRYP